MDLTGVGRCLRSYHFFLRPLLLIALNKSEKEAIASKSPGLALGLRHIAVLQSLGLGPVGIHRVPFIGIPGLADFLQLFSGVDSPEETMLLLKEYKPFARGLHIPLQGVTWQILKEPSRQSLCRVTADNDKPKYA